MQREENQSKQDEVEKGHGRPCCWCCQDAWSQDSSHRLYNTELDHLKREENTQSISNILISHSLIRPKFIKSGIGQLLKVSTRHTAPLGDKW